MNLMTENTIYQCTN